MQTFYIFDFDSTFVSVEALDELAQIALKGNPRKEQLLQEIISITNKGMNGEIPFDLSLEKRLSLFQPNKDHIKKLTLLLKKKVTSSILRNKVFFKEYAQDIYIISGGFKEYILPIVSSFGINPDHVLANDFLFNKKGIVIGYNKENVLSQKKGKVKKIRELKLKGRIIVIGDGFTDYEIRKEKAADQFFAFTENSSREKVMANADAILPSFDEFLYRTHLPRAFSFPKNRMKVLLLENINKKAATLFEEQGYLVETVTTALSQEELTKKIKDISILGIRSRTQITESVLKNAEKLLVIGAYCIGTNQINLEHAAKQGIAVFNAPYSNTRSVVELVLGEIIFLYRQISDKSQSMHKGIWDKSATGSYEIRGKKLGIIGYGSIGSQLSVLAESLGMEVYFFDTLEKLALGNARKCNSLQDLLKVADVISVHVDGRAENKNLISEKEFKRMKDGVLFLNASRGSIVDIAVLSKYIKAKKIRGAALDVFPQEPKSNTDPFISPLQGMENVILTPHIAGSTQEAQESIGAFVTERLRRYIDEGTTTLSVNFPTLQLPILQNAHRVIHTHINKPGILSQINSILAKNEINIIGQYLKTNEEIGYGITDIDKVYDVNIFDTLKKIPGTIRVRILY